MSEVAYSFMCGSLLLAVHYLLRTLVIVPAVFSVVWEYFDAAISA